MKRVLLAWSSGKDSAWALQALSRQSGVEVVGLLTALNQAAGRVISHNVRREMVERQAVAVNLPMRCVQLPWSCPDDVYEARLREAVEQAAREGITHIAFGDLFLEEPRAFRERILAGTGIDPLFPIWTTPAATAQIAREMIEAGLRATITCVDPKQLDGRFVGRPFDEQFLAELPPAVDLCGERDEFHTFCWQAPLFSQPIAIRVPGVSFHDGFWFADLVPTDARPDLQVADASRRS
jgi:uncharacterized protein (TIGR00290 family)